MKKYALAFFAAVISTPALALTEMSHGEFFERARTGNWTSPLHTEVFQMDRPQYVTKRVVQRMKNGKKRVRYVRVRVTPEAPSVQVVRVQTNARRQAVADMVAAETARQIGAQWIPTALKLAKIESSFNCGAVGPRTRHGNARGVLQVMPGSARALGYDPRRLNECGYGISAGVAHMAMCIRSGVRTHAQMASCHVAGVKGWQVRLNPRAERYRREYIRLAMR